jgi:hypothetical protein
MQYKRDKRSVFAKQVRFYLVYVEEICNEWGRIDGIEESKELYKVIQRLP